MNQVQRAPTSVIELVCVRERRRYLVAYEGGDFDGEDHLPIAAGLEGTREIGAVDVLHHEEVAASVLPEVEDLPDIRVRELNRNACLVHHHAVKVTLLGISRVDHLERDELVGATRGVRLREKDLRHASARDLSEQGVVAES